MFAKSLRVLSAAAVIATASLAYAQDSSQIGNTEQVISGSTQLTIGSSFSSFLQSNGVSVTGVATTPTNGASVTLPVVNGAVDVENGRAIVGHAGGLVFSADGHQVVVSDLTIDTTSSASISGVLTIDGNLAGRAPLFTITSSDAPTIETSGSLKIVTVNNANIAPSSQLAAYIKSEFGINVPPGASLGTANVTAVAGAFVQH